MDEKLKSALDLLYLWMMECKLQGWMLYNYAIEELLQATERELNKNPEYNEIKLMKWMY